MFDETIYNHNTRPTIALVVPCYNEESMLPISAPMMMETIDAMAAEGIADGEKSFVLFVDDGCTDNTWDVIKQLHRTDSRFKGISLSHNRGQQAALLAGLLTVRTMCDAAVTIDADLQDSLDALKEMVRRYIDGDDIVYGVRSSRQSDTWFKRNSARAFYHLQRRMGLEVIYDHSEFRLMDRKALDILSDYGESNIFLRGIMTNIGLKHSTVRYSRNPRTVGETKYSFSKLVATSIDGITSFTARPMRLIFLIGMLLLLIDIVVGIWVLISYFNGISISGWASLMISIWFFGSLMLISLGIIGEYIGKIFTEVKHRPRYSIATRLLD